MQIQELRLFTDSLDTVQDFYEQVLEVPSISSSSTSFSIMVGTTKLTFVKGERAYYHYAINIPSYQIEDAYSWIKKKTEVLPFHGNEIVDFTSWNAKALYFYDPAGNIVEFIARKNLEIPSSIPFGSKSFQHVSEIGLPVSNVNEAFDQFNMKCGLRKYSGDYERFCAIGEETGLFITIDYQQKDWIPNDDKAHPFPMEISFNHNQNSFMLVYRDEKMILT